MRQAPGAERGTSPLSLRWIEVNERHHVLPIGGRSGHVQLRQETDGTWRVDHACPSGSELAARGLTLPRAMRFAETYVLAAPHSVSLTARDAEWRGDPMSDLQHGRLLLLLGVAEIDSTMTRGQASDLFHKVKAQRALQATPEAAQ